VKFLGWLDDEPGTAAPRSETSVRAPGAGLDAVREAARSRLGRPGALSPEAGAEILRWNLARGADPAVEPAWRALLRGEGVSVMTGQQPALFGGPLYTLYKLLTAVELAAELERSLGRPALAVFWVVGDDADFGEVSSAWLPGPDGSVLRVRDEAVPPGGTLIGMLPASRQFAALDAAPSATETVTAAVTEAAAAGSDWSGFFAALIFRLLPGIPCLFIDGAHPAVVRAQSPWIREAAREWPLGDLLREGEAEARRAGFAPALDPALGERAAFHLEGARRETWNGEAAGGSTLGPNVVLRPLLQDLLLPNAATICGPSEMRYRSQLGPVYRHAGIPRPPLVPRLRAVLLPPGAPGETMPPAEAFRDPDAYLASRTRVAAPADLLERADALRSRTRDSLGSLSEQLAAYDTGLPQMVDSVAGKVDFQLQRISEAILARARQRLLRGDPRLARWREFVRPRDGEQERSLSLLSVAVLGGPAAAGALREAARGHLRRWSEGSPAAAAVFSLPAGAEEERT
jgi:bacillithiol synthase